MLAAVLLEPLCYAELSNIRWQVSQRAQDRVADAVGKRLVDAHAADMQILGVSSEIFQPRAVSPKFQRAASILCEVAVAAVAKVLRSSELGSSAVVRLSSTSETGSCGSGTSLFMGSPTSIDEKDIESLEQQLVHMAQGFGRYWAFIGLRDVKAANRALGFALRHFHRAHWRKPAWRGANLGGWLLLEPGPASPFYEVCRERVATMQDAKSICDQRSGEAPWLEDDSEHCLCKALEQVGGPSLRKQMFAEHRSKHYTTDTFDRIRRKGMNAVRIPFGYWVASGPGPGEAYEGPCLEVLDRAVALAASNGLQVLLDLHGTPGGESGGRPCGCKNDSWHWTQWRSKEAVAILAQVAQRYKDVECVTGLQVCNEPSMGIPVDVLCEYYEAAIRAIRHAGMGADRVAVVVPVFNQHRLPDILNYWQEHGNFFKFDNVAFDLHYYHNFDPFWKLLSQEQHLEIVTDHARELAMLPGALVGEWSLSRPKEWSDEDMHNWARQQVLAFNHSTHGWFFWNWHDYEHYKEWDMEGGVFGHGYLPSPLGDHLINDVLVPEWQDDGWNAVPDKMESQSWLPWVMSYVPSLQSFFLRVHTKMCVTREPS